MTFCKGVRVSPWPTNGTVTAPALVLFVCAVIVATLAALVTNSSARSIQRIANNEAPPIPQQAWLSHDPRHSIGLQASRCPAGDHASLLETKSMENETDPLAQFGLDCYRPAVDVGKGHCHFAERSWMINKQHLAQLIDLGLVEMREDVPHLTSAGQSGTPPGRFDGRYRGHLRVIFFGPQSCTQARAAFVRSSPYTDWG